MTEVVKMITCSYCGDAYPESTMLFSPDRSARLCETCYVLGLMEYLIHKQNKITPGGDRHENDS